MPQPLVLCDNLVKIYKDAEAQLEVVALQGLDLEVEAGEWVCIVGQSGSGKTTLMNILGALDTPSAGRCVVADADLTRLNERQRDAYRRFVVGHVWQQSGRNLVPDLTVAENVGLPQLLAGVAGARRAKRAAELLTLVGLGALGDQFPDQLSGGEQQRAALAVALANGPRVLLADEPTGALDSQTARQIVELLRSLNRALGLTIILVTHDPAVAAEADRTLAIRDGRTSTETVRRREADAGGAASGAPPAHDLHAQPTRVPGAPASASAIIGLPGATHVESIVIDRAGRLQLPEEALAQVAFEGRAELLIVEEHVELWPAHARAGRDTQRGGAGAVIGLPASAYRESVVIDRAGRLQLSEEALDRVPFGRHATARIAADHLELWPASRAS